MSFKLHYFNPGHETAILHDKANYTPSRNVQKMIKDLALLPAWYADEGDYILVDEIVSPRFFSTLPVEIRPQVKQVTPQQLITEANTFPALIAEPWGISPQSISLFGNIKEKSSLQIDIPIWREEYKQLTSRQTAAACLKKICELLPEYSFPEIPLFFYSVNEVKEYLAYKNGNFVLKTPFSSSGRGLLWIKNNLSEKDKSWIKGAINKQGCISIEPVVDKDGNFALEFYSDGKGTIIYEGLSLFGTAKRGAYTGNDLWEEKECISMIQQRVGKQYYENIKDTVTSVLKDAYASVYTGYLGIDMMIYKKDKKYLIHPCVEINMRHTMGLLAGNIFKNYISPRSNGVFLIKYESRPGDAYEIHRLNKQAYPLEFVNGKLRSGYISLCPITRQTHYMAMIILA